MGVHYPRNQRTVLPPSRQIVWPVMKLEASEARKTTVPMISSGPPTLFRGVDSMMLLRGLRIFQPVSNQGSGKISRSYCIDIDVVLCPLFSESFREHDDSSFRHGIHRIGYSGSDQESGCRSNIDDFASFLGIMIRAAAWQQK